MSKRIKKTIISYLEESGGEETRGRGGGVLKTRPMLTMMMVTRKETDENVDDDDGLHERRRTKMSTMMMVTLERRRTKMSTMLIVTRRRTKMSMKMETMKMATMLTPKITRLQGYYRRIAKENWAFIIKRTFTKCSFFLLNVCLNVNFVFSNFLSKNKEE